MVSIILLCGGLLALVGCEADPPVDKLVVQITIPEGYEGMIANWGSLRVSSPGFGSGDCVSYVPGSVAGVPLAVPPVTMGARIRVVAEAFAGVDTNGQPAAACSILVSRGVTPFFTITGSTPKIPMQVLMGPVGEFIKTSSAQTGGVAGGSSVVAVPTQPGTSRHGASMTSLPDGRVVIIGGAGLKPGLTESGDVNGPIWNQLTLDGAIQEVYETVEIYDPATGIFEVLATEYTSPQTMANPRMFHNAVWLDSINHIAIIGGWQQNREATGALATTLQASAVIELFDPIQKIFLDPTTVGQLQVPRAMATTTILEYTSATAGSKVDQYLLVGGGTNNTANPAQAENSYEIVNMAPNTLRVVAGPIPQAGVKSDGVIFYGGRFNHRAVIVDDCKVKGEQCVYFIGGETSSGSTQGLIDIFHVKAGALYGPPSPEFQAPSQLLQARVEHEAVYVPAPSSGQDNFIYVIGGYSDTSRKSPVSSIEVISAFNGSQLAGTDFTLKSPRGHHRAVMMDGGQVLVSGGLIADGSGGLSMATTSEIIGPTHPYDPLSNTWATSQNVLSTPASSLLTSRFGHSALFMDNDHVLVLGGAQKIGTSVLQVGPATATNTPSELYVFDPSPRYEPTGP
jgi:hypothetical protein